jgi:hypothetical protein
LLQLLEIAMTTEVKSIGLVEGRPVYPGDRLYVDIRETCATVWGDSKIAIQGANEGQGPMIIFVGGDYRMCDRLVWEPKELPVREEVKVEPISVLQGFKNPDMYTKDQLSSILEAFFDISDGVDAYEFNRITGNSCTATADNFVEAANLVAKRWGR